LFFISFSVTNPAPAPLAPDLRSYATTTLGVQILLAFPRVVFTVSSINGFACSKFMFYLPEGF